jgi:hypothetical protein
MQDQVIRSLLIGEIHQAVPHTMARKVLVPSLVRQLRPLIGPVESDVITFVPELGALNAKSEKSNVTRGDQCAEGVRRDVSLSLYVTEYSDSEGSDIDL